MLGPALGGSTPSVTIRLRSSAAVLSSPPFAEVLEGPTSAGALSSDLVDVEESLETAEVLPVAGEEREILGAGGCRDQEVDSPGAASLPTRRSHGRKDPSVRACRVGVERQRSIRCNRSWRRPRSSGSPVACGPAASSAMVTALTASSEGSALGSIDSRSTTTEVSMRPCGGRSTSATRRALLVGD